MKKKNGIKQSDKQGHQVQLSLEQVMLQISLSFDNLKSLVNNVIMQQNKIIQELQGGNKDEKAG